MANFVTNATGGPDAIAYRAFDAGETQTETVNSFSVAGGDQVVFGSNGPASEEVLRNYLLDPFKTGNAVLYAWWNGFEQSMTLNGVLASELLSSSFVFTDPTTARNVTGTSLGDVMFGSRAGDTLDGGAGDDLLIGDAGNDMLIGGAGNNRYDGGAGADTFDGSGSTSDRVDYNTVGGITLIMNGSGVGGAGSSAEALGDTFIGIELIRGSSGNDVFTLDTTVDVLFAFGGNDTITGSSDANTIRGQDGNDTIVSGGGNDTLYGDAGNDTITITGTYTTASANGGDGVDTITGGNFADTISGGAATDYINGGAGADYMDGGDGNDLFTDSDGMTGDNYVGGAGYDRITYTAAGTYDLAGTGRDVIGDDIENVIFSAQVTVQGGYRNETLTGSSFGDTIASGTGNDIVAGNSGNDELSGEAGNDKLYGGLGEDLIRGGIGSDNMTGGNAGVTTGDGSADQFYYELADVDLLTDRITDFEIGLDKIALDSASFGMTAGAFDPARFYHTGDTIAGTQSVFIYNSATGLLTFDANGSAGGGVYSMVFLTGNPAISADDIVIV